MKRFKRMSFANIVASVIFIGISIFAIQWIMQFKRFSNVPVGPEVFPMLMAIGVIICSVVLLIQSLLSKSEEAAPSMSFKKPGMIGVLVSVAVTAAMIWLWEPVGFLILSPIVLLVFMLMLGYRKVGMLVAVAVLVPVVVWLLFYKVLSISIPIGPLEIIYDFF
ncbi:MAG: tripartite tricarboxylate transporter TctB family protein [Clostridia bacterium]|nr:tripartite tricarboxylate transporter TctB family protein [Clostridia bacterium]